MSEAEQLMMRVTRNIDLESASDLLDHATRACIAFAGFDGPEMLPVMFARQADRFLAGLPAYTDHQPTRGQEAVLLVDDGVHFFDLRAVYVRGRLRPVEAPADTATGYRWFDLSPTKTIVWDYGALRKVDDAT